MCGRLRLRVEFGFLRGMINMAKILRNPRKVKAEFAVAILVKLHVKATSTEASFLSKKKPNKNKTKTPQTAKMCKKI